MERHQIKVTLEGLAPLVFDRFWGHSKEEIPPDRKLYLADENKVVMPLQNLKSFLQKEKPPGAIKIVEKVKFNEYIRIAQTHIDFGTVPYYPILDGAGQPVIFTNFEDGRWEILLEATCTKASTGAVIKQEPLPRPMLKLPWRLELEIGIWRSDINTKITEDKVRSWFEIGGILVALGNHRPDYGRFQVTKWE
ncbi:MAG: hypothetical protein ACLQVJ_07955 [Syntrophobacteraceae bacterium]